MERRLLGSFLTKRMIRGFIFHCFRQTLFETVHSALKFLLSAIKYTYFKEAQYFENYLKVDILFRKVLHIIILIC